MRQLNRRTCQNKLRIGKINNFPSMASVLEEKLREAACVGDIEAVQALVAQNVNVNSQNSVNGWTALHWASKRGHEDITRFLLNYGADPNIENHKGEKPSTVCSNPAVLELLGEPTNNLKSEAAELKYIPHYIRNPPLNGTVDIGPKLRPRHTDFNSMPTTVLPAQNEELVLKVRIAGSNDPDFIEVEIPRWKLTYSALMSICCEELEIKTSQVERIRKLPDVRLRKDNDVKRLMNNQSLELVLKSPINIDKYINNCYQSISTCKDQTILY